MELKAGGMKTSRRGFGELNGVGGTTRDESGPKGRVKLGGRVKLSREGVGAYSLWEGG